MDSDKPEGGAVPEESPKAEERSGATVEEAADDTAHRGVERPPSEAVSGESPVEQTRGDPAMTGGQVASGPGNPGGPQPAPPTAPPPEANLSGGAQSMPGARTSDRVAAMPHDDEPEIARRYTEPPATSGVRRLADPKVLLGLFSAVALFARRRRKARLRRSTGGVRARRRRGRS